MQLSSRMVVFMRDGSLNFKAMVYQPVWDSQGRLTRIGHISGQSVDIAKKHGDKMDDNYMVKDNFNDAAAAFVMESMPPIPIIDFFNECVILEAGPHAGPRFIGKKGSAGLFKHDGGCQD